MGSLIFKELNLILNIIERYSIFFYPFLIIQEALLILDFFFFCVQYLPSYISIGEKYGFLNVWGALSTLDKAWKREQDTLTTVIYLFWASFIIPHPKD